MKITKPIREELARLRADKVNVDGKFVPRSVPFLAAMLVEELDTEERDEILYYLANEYASSEMSHEYLAILRKRAENLPADVNVLLSLADASSSHENGREEAVEALERALRFAREQDEHVRTALGVQARIARRWNDSKLYQAAILGLVDDAARDREIDIGFQRDIIEGVTAALCPPQLIARYLETERQL